MNTTWEKSAEAVLGSNIASMNAVGGGDFARAYQAQLVDGRFVFIKTHENPPAHFFSTEATGLEWLRSASAVNVPNVLAVQDAPPFLAMEWIDIGLGNDSTEEQFGKDLAALHRSHMSCFGRPDHRTTGSQALPNSPFDTWSDFYATQRLLPLAKLSHDKNALPKGCVAQIETLASKLDEFGAADESPSLLHGDLWAGNRVVDTAGNSWLIDPAAHGGHREFDLAMMQLFGGYGDACFSAYNTSFPLSEGWQSRVALHQLAPLIVHAIKFGSSYGSATKRALNQYV